MYALGNVGAYAGNNPLLSFAGFTRNLRIINNFSVRNRNFPGGIVYNKNNTMLR